MGLNSLGLGFVFTARDLASGKLGELERRFASLDDRVTGGTERITGSFRALGTGLSVFGAGAGAIAGAFALADSLGELTPQAAAGLAAQAMKAFGLSIDDASISVDRMLQAVNVFALNANKLPLALGTASRGAQALHQSLSETLIALGLIKNVIPGVERASTGAAVAMERLAGPQVQRRLRGVGVAVVDNKGGFRAFLDVLGDLAPALDRMTEAQRSAFLLQRSDARRWAASTRS